MGFGYIHRYLRRRNSRAALRVIHERLHNKLVLTGNHLPHRGRMQVQVPPLYDIHEIELNLPSEAAKGLPAG